MRQREEKKGVGKEKERGRKKENERREMGGIGTDAGKKKLQGRTGS